jgi:hypothetical protein
MTDQSIKTPEVLTENNPTMHDYLKQSYQHAKKQIGSEITRIKDDFSDMFNHAGHYVNSMVLPINNYLKDFNQIEAELSQEIYKEDTHYMSIDGQLVPAEHVLNRPMEENY